MDLKELDRVNPEVHWYHQSKLTAILKLIRKNEMQPNSLVDVGAGSGFFGRATQRELQIMNLICVDKNYPEEWSEPGILFKTSSSGCSADLYLFIDVLEHVQDDKSLVKEYFDKAPPHSFFIVTVPAFMSLWSGHDEYLEHIKRYKVGELENIVEGLGARTISKGYLFSLIFPLAWFVRRFSRSEKNDSSMKEISRPLNTILRSVTSLEHQLTTNRFIGLSAYILFRKS
jgi:hypothetical protein